MKRYRYKLVMTHPRLGHNVILNYQNKVDAEEEYKFFHSIGMSVSLREETYENRNSSKTILSDWNRHLYSSQKGTDK